MPNTKFTIRHIKETMIAFEPHFIVEISFEGKEPYEGFFDKNRFGVYRLGDRIETLADVHASSTPEGAVRNIEMFYEIKDLLAEYNNDYTNPEFVEAFKEYCEGHK